MRKLVIGLCVALLIIFPSPVSITAAASNQHYTGEVVTANDFTVLKHSEIVVMETGMTGLINKAIPVQVVFRLRW